MLDPQFHGADRPARRCSAACSGSDDYLAQWHWSDEQERDGTAQDVADAVKRRARSEGRLVDDAARSMPRHAHRSTDDRIDARRRACRSSTPPSRLGVRVPTSCVKQGKCKECMVEVTEGMELLSPPTTAEQHLQGQLPPVVPVPRSSADAGEVHCHTMRRGQMRIERHALDLPAQPRRRLPLDPAVDARRRSHPASTARKSRARPARFTASRWTSARRPSSCGCSISKPASWSPTRRSRTRSASAART